MSQLKWLLTVDSNEQSHYAKRKVDRAATLAQRCGDTAVVRPMDCGDYALVLVDTDGSERCVALIERKMAQDMAASIPDTRYVSQSRRMEASGAPCAYWFIVGSELHNPSDADSVESAMVHLNTPYFPHTRVMHLSDDSTAFVQAILRLKRYLYDFYANGAALADVPLYTATQEAGAKPRMDSQAVVWVEQLTIPRGMSRPKARAVAARFTRASALLDEYKRVETQWRENDAVGRKNKKRTMKDAMEAALEDVPLPNGKRLGPACSVMICRTFLGDE